MNKVFIKWYEKLGENLVRKVFENFDIIEREFYEERDKEMIVDSYLKMEYERIENYRKIKNLKEVLRDDRN